MASGDAEQRFFAVIDLSIYSTSRHSDFCVTEGEMNFAFEGGDKSPHSKSDAFGLRLSRLLFLNRHLAGAEAFGATVIGADDERTFVVEAGGGAANHVGAFE